MKLPYVNYEQATKLKKLGFDWYCQSSFVGNEFTSYMAWNNTWKLQDKIHQFPREKGTDKLAKDVRPMIAAPTVALALKWLRDVHNLVVEINAPDLPEAQYLWPEKHFDANLHIPFKYGSKGDAYGNTYDECESNGLDMALDYLIKQKT